MYKAWDAIQIMYEAIANIGGRSYYVLVPDAETNVARGIVTGPPDLSELNLPPDVEATLHQELFGRGIKNKRIAVKRRQAIYEALQASFAVCVDKVVECYDANTG